MKCTFDISDIYINKSILQSILYCDPFIDFNNHFINQINILITEQKVQLDIVKDSNILKSIIIEISLRNINFKKFKQIRQKNFHCEFDQNFTLLMIQKLLNTIDVIIFELLKYYQLVRKRLKLRDNMFVLVNVDKADYIVGFPINCEINNMYYNYCLFNAYLWSDDLLICQFRLQNTNSTDVMDIDEIILDDLQTIIAFKSDESMFIDDAHFIILLPLFQTIEIADGKKNFKNLLVNNFVDSLYNEELMNDFSSIDNFIYNIAAVCRFIQQYINILFKNICMFFSIFILDDNNLNNSNLMVKDEFNEEN